MLDVHLDAGNPVEGYCYSWYRVPDSLEQDLSLKDFVDWSVDSMIQVKK